MQIVRAWKRTRVLLALVVLFLLTSVPLRQAQDTALAQTGAPYDLTWSSIDGGGGTFSTGGDYTLGGTIGQPDAGFMQGSDYTLGGGFWGGGDLTPPDYKLYLLLVLRSHQ